MRYTVKLTENEFNRLKMIMHKGTHSSQTFRAAFILLNCDEGVYSNKVTNYQISKSLMIGLRTIDRVKKRYVEGGMEHALSRHVSRRKYDSKVSADIEERLVGLCSSEPPGNYSRWTLRLLAKKMVELKYVGSISHGTVRNVLKRMKINIAE